MCSYVGHTHTLSQRVLWLVENCLTLYTVFISLQSTGADEPPLIVSISIETTSFSAFLEWMELPVNSPFVIGYNITVENLYTNATRTIIIDGSSHEANVTGLTPFQMYSFVVTADYKYGLGPPSEAVVQWTGK